jgi:hypothetical protein
MDRLNRFQRGLMPVCILALVAGSSLARIPHQDKPAPGATPATSEKQAGAATPPVKTPASAPADAKSGATKTVPAAAGTAGKDKAQPAATPPPVVPQPAQPPVTVVVQQPAAPQQDASSGWIGILIAVALGYTGFRYAQNKGFTVVGMLTKAGVTLPKDPDPVPQAQRPGNTATALPPLPGLDTLLSPVPGTAAQSPTAGITASGPLILVATDGQASGKRFKLSGTMTIGREMSCNIPLTNDQTISRNHAEVLCSPDGSYTVTDKGSSNGTFVNSTRVTGSTQLVAGDTLVVGAQRFRIEVDA